MFSSYGASVLPEISFVVVMFHQCESNRVIVYVLWVEIDRNSDTRSLKMPIFRHDSPRLSNPGNILLLLLCLIPPLPGPGAENIQEQECQDKLHQPDCGDQQHSHRSDSKWSKYHL